MADQGKWFKLHVGWDDDPHISSLSLADQARWCKFGTYMKEHGTDGSILLIEPAKTLQHRFEVSSFDEVLQVLQRFPNYDVSEKHKRSGEAVTTVTVTIKNWSRYQADFSRDRMRKLRANVTAKKRREEKRPRRDVEEKRIHPPKSPPDAGPYRIPEKATDPVGYMVMQYKIRKIGHDNFDNRAWDKSHWPRAAAAAKDLLEVIPNADDARKCLLEVADGFDGKNLSWTFETVVKWSHEWKARKGHGLSNSERFLGALTQQRSTGGLTPVGEGIGKQSDPNRLRDLPPIQSEAGADNRRLRSGDESLSDEMVESHQRSG